MFFVFPRIITQETCNEIIEDCKQNISGDASVLNPDFSARDDPTLRKTNVSFIEDSDNKINEFVWGFIREANKIQFNYDLKYFQPIQFASYQDGGFYGWHQDSSGEDSSNEIRKLSLSMILSDPNTFEGGKLEFYNGNRPMENMGEITGEQVTNDIKAQGSVIVFDSRDFHRVTPVTSGVRHSIVCWCVGPNFK